jgi:hypothetical protein
LSLHLLHLLSMAFVFLSKSYTDYFRYVNTYFAITLRRGVNRALNLALGGCIGRGSFRCMARVKGHNVGQMLAREHHES